MNFAGWLTLSLSAIAIVYATYDFVKKLRQSRKDKIKMELSGDEFIVDSAIKLLKPYEDRVARLIVELADAEETVRTTRRQLDIAHGQIEILNGQLVDARAQVTFLQLQVKGITDGIEGGES